MRIFSENIFSFLFLLPLTLFINTGKDVSPRIKFPVPPKSENLLFYLQRTVNTNTILYELNLNKNGEINMLEPIKINWIQFAKDTTYEPLTYIQKTFAYGLETRLIDSLNKSFMIHFVSYKKKPLYLLKSPSDHKYHVYMHINNTLSILEKIFVQIDGGTFWFPEISFVEVSGAASATLKPIKETISP